MFHLLRLCFRLLIFLIIAAIGCTIYLVKRADRPSFTNSIQSGVQSALTAGKCEMKGCARSGGFLSIRRFTAEGGDDTFFRSLEARSIRGKMGLLDGLVGRWDLGTISISRLNVDLRAGANDEAMAKQLGDAFFKNSDKVSLNNYEVADATLRWGYSETTSGAIENSLMKIQRQESSAKLTFHGGTFSQNWLRKLEIVDLVVMCNRDSIQFEKATFKRGTGTVDLSGMKITCGEIPKLDGLAKIRNIGLDHALPAAFSSFLEGSFSSDLKVFGSTNTAEGVGFDGLVTLEGQDLISLRDGFHLLKALSVVDYSRNYRRVDLRQGSFKINTQGGGMKLTEVQLKAENLLSLTGGMKVRLPTAEEKATAAKKNPESRGLFANGINPNDATAKTEQQGGTTETAVSEMEKSAAAKAEDPIADRLELSEEMRRLNAKTAEADILALRYEGGFTASLLPDAFERSPKLLEKFPVDPRTQRINLLIPIEGDLYEITLKQAEEVYQLGRR